ncbi:MAG: acyltransferase family protein [Nitriliruptoraceae bacterium]
MTAATGPSPEVAPSAISGRSQFRQDIEGLRAVAVLLVLGYHAGIPQLAGGFIGVDVFFVISGFLITGILLKEVERTGTLNLASFYSRRARRLLPASSVVLLASAAVTVAVIPVTRWVTIAWDLVTSALYVTNWRLAGQAVDYLAADVAPSPVQHFWTLAVEEQFYVVWPLLLLVLVQLHRRTGWPLRQLLLTGIGVLAGASLLWSVQLTFASPSRAYFVTTTRIWELAIGAMLAFGIGRAADLPVLVSKLLAAGGLLAIFYAAFTFDATTAFPGAAALIPTLGAAAVIAAGAGHITPGVSRLLTNRPMTAIGGLSYSLYLWHWPLLVGAREIWAEPGQPLPVMLGVVVVIASGVPAWLTFRLIERPIHHWPALADNFRRNAVLAFTCTAVALTAAVAVLLALPASVAQSDSTVVPIGAHALKDAAGTGVSNNSDTTTNLLNADGSVTFVPGPIEALQDVAELDGNRCILSLEAVALEPCLYGPAHAETTVAVVGDSKMHQWLPAIQQIADQRGWRVITYLKSGCALSQVPMRLQNEEPNRPCIAHNELRFAKLLGANDIDIVITSQAAKSAYTPKADLAAGRRLMIEDLASTWDALDARGIDVLVVFDNAAPPMNVPDCVAENLDNLSACDFSRNAAIGASAAPVQLEALRHAPRARPVDLQDGICRADICSAVVGNVLVYRQGSHLTATYVDSLSEWLDQAIQDALK